MLRVEREVLAMTLTIFRFRDITRQQANPIFRRADLYLETAENYLDCRSDISPESPYRNRIFRHFGHTRGSFSSAANVLGLRETVPIH